MFVLTLDEIQKRYNQWYQLDALLTSVGLNGYEIISRDQFTGLKDKNGKDIYEGDLFQVAGNRVYTIKYFGESENNFERAFACFCLTIPESITIPIDEWALKNGEIIGNIHQNPELLKS